jgi:hypothetical protein
MSRRLAVFSLMNPLPYEADLNVEPSRDDIAYRVHALLSAHVGLGYPERGLGYAVDEQAVRDLADEAKGLDYSTEFGNAYIVPLLDEHGIYWDFHRIERNEQAMAFSEVAA